MIINMVDLSSIILLSIPYGSISLIIIIIINLILILITIRCLLKPDNPLLHSYSLIRASLRGELQYLTPIYVRAFYLQIVRKNNKKEKKRRWREDMINRPPRSRPKVLLLLYECSIY